MEKKLIVLLLNIVVLVSLQATIMLGIFVKNTKK